jgi:glycosyltransferase involved in cell wall biosynthesis
MNPEVLVNICITAYNIEKYLSECLDSILKQKVNFKYNIIIGEDRSTDSTMSICKKYEKEYSNVIIYQNEKNLGNMMNMIATLSKCKSKYIALMDGDDLWISENKLQSQIDFLENNSQYSLCFHDAKICNEDLSFKYLYSDRFKGRNYEIPYSLHQLVKWRILGATSSIVFRNQYLEYPFWVKNLYGPDAFIFFYCYSFGKIKYFNEVMSIYRVHSGSTDRSYSKIKLAERNVMEYNTYRTVLSPSMKLYFFRKLFRNYFYIIYLNIRNNNFLAAFSAFGKMIRFRNF